MIQIDIVEKQGAKWRIIGMGPKGFEALHVSRGKNATVRDAETDCVIAQGSSLNDVLRKLAEVAGCPVQLNDEILDKVIATFTPTKVEAEPIKAEAAAQAEGAAYGKAGKALVGNCSWSGEAARLAFTHGWMTHHESCDCRISGGIGYTFDLATHAMIKNPPARQYTQAELDRAARRRGYVPATWRSKHKGSKACRVRSHA